MRRTCWSLFRDRPAALEKERDGDRRGDREGGINVKEVSREERAARYIL